MSLWPLESRREWGGEAGREQAPVSVHSTLPIPTPSLFTLKRDPVRCSLALSLGWVLLELPQHPLGNLSPAKVGLPDRVAHCGLRWPGAGGA